MARGDRNSTVISIFNNPWKKFKVLRTIALYCSFLALGLCASIFGPTIISMEILLNTDTKSISAAIAGNALGYLGGSLLCGVIYSVLNKELLFMVSMFGISLATGLAPFGWHLFMYVAACVVQGLCMGMIDTAGQSYIMKLWEDHRYKEPVMQGAHLVWSVGTTIGPFIIHPFLADVSDIIQAKNISLFEEDQGFDLVAFNTFQDNNVSQPNNATDLVESYDIAVTTEFPMNFTDMEEDILARVGYVRLAYVVIAGLSVLCTICFIVAFFLLKPSCRDTYKQKKDEDDKTTYTKAYRCFKISLLVFMFFLFFIYAWVETVPGSFLAAFVVKGLGWPNKHGALITALYWGGIGVGRLLGVPFAACISSRNMLIINITFTFIGFAMMLFVRYLELLVWVGAVVSGLGMGTIMPSATLWVGEYMELTGGVSAVLLASSSVGQMAAPVVTGYLLDVFNHKVFVYIVVFASFAQICVFVGAHCYVQANSGLRRTPASRKRPRQDETNNSLNMTVEMKPLNLRQQSSDEPELTKYSDINT